MNDSKAIITKVHIQGYRSLEDVVVDLNPITVLVGPNGSGTSSSEVGKAHLPMYLSSCKIAFFLHQRLP